MDVLPVRRDDDDHDEDDGDGDLPAVGDDEGAAGQAQHEEDLVGRVGHGRERVAGEDREGEPLGQERVAEPVAPHRPAEDEALEDATRSSRTRQLYDATGRLRATERSAGRMPHGVASRRVHFVIMGCGRVGSTLAKSLSKRGHDVAIIDAEPAAFRRLGSSFEGMTVTGIGFDRDTLMAARIDEAYAFAAVTSGDNSNILAARVARETFGVEHVAARIYDPGRAMVYQRLGIPTVATVRWTVRPDAPAAAPPGRRCPALTDPSGESSSREVPLARSWVGRRLTEVEERSPASRIAFITRLGDGLIPRPDTVFQDGDQIHVVGGDRRPRPRSRRSTTSLRRPTDVSTRDRRRTTYARRHHRSGQRRAVHRP